MGLHFYGINHEYSSLDAFAGWHWVYGTDCFQVTMVPLLLTVLVIIDACEIIGFCYALALLSRTSFLMQMQPSRVSEHLIWLFFVWNCGRHAHNVAFQKSDLFFICLLRPLSNEIKIDEAEIQAAKVDAYRTLTQRWLAKRASVSS